MYYFALLDDNGVCISIEEWGEYNGELEGNPYYLQLPEYDYSLIRRKKYVNGEWVDATASEGQNYDGMHVGLRGEWLDVVVDNKADVDHTHDGYVSQDDLDLLEDVIDNKADANHTHDGYASVGHSHSEYALQTSLDTLGEEVDGKANVSHTHNEYAEVSHTHSEYAESSHSHSNYANVSHQHDGYSLVTHTHTASEVGASPSNHNHDNAYSGVNHNHNTEYSAIGHDHDENYAVISHSHTNYATTTALEEVSAIASGKANANHSHGDLYYTESEVNDLLAGKSDSSHNHTGVYDASGSASSALASAKAYTDSEIETLGETVSAKANTSDLTSHTGNTTIHITSTERTNWNTAKSHADSAHAPSNAQPNQNAFSNVVVGNTTISADNATDTLTFVAGSNITLTPDATGDSITISSANTVYTHPTSAGNKHIPAGGSSGQILRWASDGTAVWGNDNNTTYSNATQNSSGLMSDTDKTKLDGVEDGANNYTLPSAGSSLGGVKSGGDVTISSGIITVNDDSHNHVISNVDGLQAALDGKAASSHSHNSVYYTETEVDTLLSGKANSSHTHAIADITNLQNTLNGKASSSHTHSSATTTTAGLMSASDKAKLDGIANGANAYTLPTASSTLGGVKTTSTVTSASGYTACPIIGGVPYYKDTNTTYTLSSFGITATASELNYVDGVTGNIQTQLNGKAASSHSHSAATTSANGLMSASDKSKLDGMVLATVSEVETYLGI